MANQEHVDLLKQGVDVWNAWRKKCPDIHLDLSHIILSHATLTSANLSRVNLGGASLGGANLSYALQLHFLPHQQRAR